MARLDIYLAGYDITDEIINRSSSSSLKLDHDTIRGTADIEIWTGAGGTGTQLALTTDYTVAGEDTRLSTLVGGGVSVYTTLAIVNGAYHSTPLYVSYKTIGDYASVSSSRLIQIGYKEITGNYTVTANDRTIIVNTASAVTITLPEGLPIGFDVDIMRLVASTNAVTVAKTGSDTIEGGSTFITHGAFASSTLNDQKVTIQKKSSTSWKFVSGVVKGSTSAGTYRKYPERTLIQNAFINTDVVITEAYDSQFRGAYTWVFPVQFADISYISSMDITCESASPWTSLYPSKTTSQRSWYLHDEVSRASINVNVELFALGIW